MAFAGVQKRQRRKARLILGTVGGFVVSAAVVLYQGHLIRKLEAEATAFFDDTKRMEVDLVNLRKQLEESGSPELASRVSERESEIQGQGGPSGWIRPGTGALSKAEDQGRHAHIRDCSRVR